MEKILYPPNTGQDTAVDIVKLWEQQKEAAEFVKDLQ